MQSFFEYYSNTAWDDLHAGTFGTGHSLNLPVPTLHIPLNNVSTKITGIRYNRTPIIVFFENGSQWKLTKKQWDYLVSIGKEIKVGKMVDIQNDNMNRVVSVNVR